MAIQAAFFYGSVGFLTVFLLVQIFKRPLFPKIVKPAFFIFVLATLAYLSYLTYLQYQAFQDGPLQTTLSSKDGLIWFAGYVRLHFWNQYLVSLALALIILWVAEYWNKRKGEILMEREELYVAALGIFSVGYPGFLFYIVLVLLLSALCSLMFVKRGERLPLYYFWIPTAISVLLAIQFWAQGQGWWSSFRF